MLDRNKRFKIILGTLVPIFIILFVIGFCLLMIGYKVGSQDDNVKVMWSLVIAGWITFAIGVGGYFTMFTIVLVRRRNIKKKQPVISVPTVTLTPTSTKVEK